jgi:hypothetical protein
MGPSKRPRAVSAPDRVRDRHPSGVEPEKLVVLTDPDLIPPREELDRSGVHPAESRTCGDGALDHIDDEQLIYRVCDRRTVLPSPRGSVGSRHRHPDREEENADGAPP